MNFPIMSKATPEEVLKAVSTDFKLRGISQETAAKMMNYGSRQTLSNLLSSKKYMSGYHAKQFNEAFGYNMEYLMSGEGELLPKILSDASSIDPIRYHHSEDPHYHIKHERRDSDEDIQLILSWIHMLLEKLNDAKGFAILSEIYRFSQARSVTRRMMRGYKGDSYDQEYDERLTNLQNEIIENVGEMLSNLTVKENLKG